MHGTRAWHTLQVPAEPWAAFKRSAARHMRATTVIKFYTHEDRQSDLHGEGGVQRSQHEQRERGHVRSESSWQPRYAPRILLSTQRNTRTPVPYCARALESRSRLSRAVYLASVVTT